MPGGYGARDSRAKRWRVRAYRPFHSRGIVSSGDLDADVYYGHEDDIHGMRTVEKEDEGDVFDRCCNHRTILLGAILVACAWLLYTHAPYIMQQACAAESVFLLLPAVTQQCMWPTKMLFKRGTVTVVETNGTRALRFGVQTETVVRLDVAGGYRSPALYVAAIVRVISHLHPQASHGRLVLLGVGGASLFHELLKQNFAQFQELIGVEADPELYAIRERFFAFEHRTPAANSTLVTHVVQDAARFMRDAPGAVNVAVNDCYTQTSNTIPTHLSTPEFTRLVFDRLEVGGYYVVNVVSHVDGSGREPFRWAVSAFTRIFNRVELYVVDKSGWPRVPPFWQEVQDRTARLQNFARQRGVNGSRWSRDGQARWMLNAVRNQARKRVLMRPSVKETGQQNILVVGIKMGDQVGRLPAMKHNLPLHEVLQPR